MTDPRTVTELDDAALADELARVMGGLTPLQQQFVAALPGCGWSLTAAYRVASPKAKGARQSASRLVNDSPAVARAIALTQEKHLRASGVSAQRIIDAHAAIAFADPRHLLEWSGDAVQLRPSAAVSDRAATTIQSIRQTKDGVAITFADRQASLAFLGRHFDVKGAAEQMEVAGKDGGPVQVDSSATFAGLIGRFRAAAGDDEGEGGE